MSISVKDIARLAKVSHTTVSRALNDSPLIKEETKTRIKELAKKLNYVPNISAKSLALERSYNIGLFVSKAIEELHTSFFYEVMEGINSVIGDTYNLIPQKFTDINDLLEKTSRRKYDGILFLSMNVSDIKLVYNLAALNIPMVILNRFINDSEFYCVYADERSGAFSAVEYLIKQGHSRVAIIEGPDMFITSDERYSGYVDALSRYNIPLVKDYTIKGGFTPESGYLAMEKLLETNPRPTAVFISNDLMSVGAIKACNQNGFKVPDDISIFGFDDMDFSKFLIPSLTTVRKSRNQMGAQGASSLLCLIGRLQPESGNNIIKTELVFRDSCKSM